MTQKKTMIVGVVVVLVALLAGSYAVRSLHPLVSPVTADSGTTTPQIVASEGKLASIDSYVTQNITFLSPVKASMGGTFYVTGLDAAMGKGVVHYEDGHNAYVADFTYTDEGNGAFKVNSFIVR